MSLSLDQDTQEFKKLLWLFVTAFHQKIGERLSFKRLLHDDDYLSEQLLRSNASDIEVLRALAQQISSLKGNTDKFAKPLLYMQDQSHAADSQYSHARQANESQPPVDKASAHIEEKYRGRLR